MSILTYILLCCFLLQAGIAQQQPIAATESGCEQGKQSQSQEVVEIKNVFRGRQLAGVVASPSGPLVPGVGVEMIDHRERCLKAVRTDADGRFDLGIKKAGTYRLRLSKDGFNTVLAPVKISHESKEELRLELPMSN